MRMILAALLTLALPAQVPDEAFFKGDPKQIILTCADRARSLKPRKGRILAQAGRAHLVAGDRAGAEDAFRAAPPEDAETTRWIAQAWLEAGDTATALRAFEAMPLRQRSDKNPIRDGAVILMDAGHAKEGEALMLRSFAFDPKDWQNLTDFARACLRQDRPELAAAWFARAAGASRKDEELWMGIAQAYADKGAER